MEPIMSDTLLSSLEIFHYLSPALVGLYHFFTVSFAPQKARNDASDHMKGRKLALGLLFAVTLTFAVEAAARFFRGFMHQEWAPQHSMIYNLASLFIWGCMTSTLSESPPSMWRVCVNAWTIGTTLDLILLGLSLAPQSGEDGSDAISLLLHLTRLLLLVLLLSSTVFASHSSRHQKKHTGEAMQPLGESVVPSGDQSQHSGFSPSFTELDGKREGTDAEQDTDDTDDEDDKEFKQLQRSMDEQGSLGYLKSFSAIVPYIWPHKNQTIQLWLGGMVVSVVSERFLAVLIPRQLGIITDALTGISETGYFPWDELFNWAMLKFISISAGMDLLRTMAITRITGHTYKQLTSAALKHVMSLSMDYHTTKGTGDLMKAIEQGADISSVLDAVFQGAPLLIDLIVAALYLSSAFNDAYMALIIVTTCSAYVHIGMRGASAQGALRRERNKKSRKENEILYDAISNWQTVSYHNQQQFEQDRHLKAVDDNVGAEVRFWDSNLYSDAAQSFVMAFGLLSACFLAAYRISTGAAPIGHLVLLVTYWANIENPLGQLTYTYRRTASELISAERLLQLLQTKPSVQNKEGAKELQVKEARVDFSNVSFAYNPRKPTLSSLNITAHPGQTVALVGETGGGKSTTLKLLMRFYDVTGGSIKIDGQDIRDVTLSSLRDALGVVPQDPSLFNESIMNNIRYSRPSATDEEVHHACKAAAIHGKILSFPDGYDSKVGERGVRLSGGELQRVAIARLLLKKPQIVLLDEATSAIDSSTEAQIQDAFKALSAGRTTFVIAHRLSTVMDADLILVIVNGRVVEQGSHSTLLRKGGEYAALWSKQISKRDAVTTGSRKVE